MKSITGAVKKVGTKGVNTLKDVKTYWNEPREGEYVSNKEFLYFILGAGGCQGAGEAERYLSFSAGCYLVGAIYGLAMKDFVVLGIVGLVLSYVFSPVGMLVNDNLGRVPKKTMKKINIAEAVFACFGICCYFVPQKYFEFIMPAFPQILGNCFVMQVFSTYFRIAIFRRFASKHGKYKPWIFVNYVPFVLSSILLIYFPYGEFMYYQRFFLMHLMFSIWGMFAGYNDQVGAIEKVITPNTVERTRIMSIGSLCYNLFPSITGLVLPVMVAASGGFTSLRSFRGPILFLMLFFSPLSLLLAFKVKDRVIIDFDRRPEINFMQGAKAAIKNKYLWINTLSGSIGSFAWGGINIVTIMIVYTLRRDWMFGVIATFGATANIPGYLTANWFIKKFGKRKLVLATSYITSFISIFIIGAVYLNNLYLIIIIQYIGNVVKQIGDLSGRGMDADIIDYQQYICGERLDSFMGIIGMIAAPYNTVAALIVPAVYAAYGFTSDWNVLFDPVIRSKIFFFTVIIGTVGGILSIIPRHFYDLTEDKHAKIITELKRREEERLAKVAQTEGAAGGEAVQE